MRLVAVLGAMSCVGIFIVAMDIRFLAWAVVFLCARALYGEA